MSGHARLAILASFAFAAALPCVSAGGLHAQTIVGHAVDRATAAPIHGVFVSLEDPEGRRLPGGALTDRDGRFVLRAPASGRYTLRADRIGYRPTSSPPLDVGTGVTGYRFDLASDAVELAALRVEGEGRGCRIEPDEAVRVQVLWDQVRTAMEVAVWTEGTGFLRFDRVLYDRRLDPLSDRVLEELVRGRRVVGRPPFLARDPEELVALGFVRADTARPDPAEREPGYEFFGLDAATIVSQAFLDTHCFRLRGPSRGREGMVGLAFEPLARRTVPDVRGVLWVDEATAELRTLEYTYTWLPWSVPTEAFGGRTDFRRLPSGAWIIERWSIRMPEVDRSPRPDGGAVRPAHETLAALRAEAGLRTREQSGEVVGIYTGAGLRLPGPDRAALQGFVHDSIGDRPLAGAMVRLAGTEHEATTDERGRFRMNDLPDGRYALTFEHEVLNAWGVAPAAVDVVLEPGDLTVQDLGVPSLGSILAGGCPARGPGAGEPLVGRVVDADSGLPLAGTRITFRLLPPRRPAEGPPEAAPAGTPGGGPLETWTNDAGVFRFCEVPDRGAGVVRADYLGQGHAEATLAVSSVAPAFHEFALRLEEPIPLDPIVVAARRAEHPALAGIYERVERIRRLGIGTVLDRADIRRRNPLRLTDMLAELPGVRAEYMTIAGRSAPVLVASRARPSGRCPPMLVYVDGMPMDFDDHSIDDLVQPIDVEAVEVYTSPAQVPAEFAGVMAPCGVIAIWTAGGPGGP